MDTAKLHEKTLDEAIDAVEGVLKMVALERSFAYEAALGVVQNYCLPRSEGDFDWWETDFSEGEVELIADAIAYLEWRGLLERHPTNATWVRVRDED